MGNGRDGRRFAARRGRIKKRVWQFAHPQRHLQRPLRVRLKNAVEERLQVRVRVLVDAHDRLAARDRTAAARLAALLLQLRHCQRPRPLTRPRRSALATLTTVLLILLLLRTRQHAATPSLTH